MPYVGVEMDVPSLLADHPAASNNWGLFPFGRPNTVRPARRAIDRCDAVVVGVYPSAWHISWTAPAFTMGHGHKGAIAAVAVDVEPTVFWDGAADDFAVRLRNWTDAVAFIEGDKPGQHGHVSPIPPSSNGSSGRKVVQHYLEPLNIDVTRTTFTDIYPVFLIKRSGSTGGGGRRREQGDAIRDEYDTIAGMLGRETCSLPGRISPGRLPAIAAATFGRRIVEDLAEASAPLVITLGEEVWRTFCAIPELKARSHVAHFSEMYGEQYGKMGLLTIGGRETDWLPLVHPGLLKGTTRDDFAVDMNKRSGDGWNALHARWVKATRATTKSR